MRNQHLGAPAGNLGITLIEILAVLVLILILVSLAAPSLSGMIDRATTRGALNRLTADVFYARTLAVREGARVVLLFEADGFCPHTGSGTGTRSYRILLRGAQPREVKAVDFRSDAPGLCINTDQSDSIAFNSRGLQVRFTNRTVRATLRSATDTLRISVAGRVYRRY